MNNLGTEYQSSWIVENHATKASCFLCWRTILKEGSDSRILNKLETTETITITAKVSGISNAKYVPSPSEIVLLHHLLPPWIYEQYPHYNLNVSSHVYSSYISQPEQKNIFSPLAGHTNKLSHWTVVSNSKELSKYIKLLFQTK